MKKLALITGASAGIGRATSELLAGKEYDLIITGRRKERLEELKRELESSYPIKVTPACFDISDKQACQDFFKGEASLLQSLHVLVNNAGLAKGVDPMDTATLEDWDGMIDTNVKGLLYMTRLSIPFLKKNPSSHIVNVGSVAGRWVYPGGGVYCSTKFAVRAITEGLRLDLNGTGIRVTNISPGMVETEFSLVRLKSQEKANAVYEGMTPLTAADIAESISWCIDRPSHVNIQELVIFPTDQASVGLVHRS